MNRPKISTPERDSWIGRLFLVIILYYYIIIIIRFINFCVDFFLNFSERYICT